METTFVRKTNKSQDDLTIFDNHLVYVDNIEIVASKKCNLACKHCMRGNSQNETIKKEVFDELFKKIAMFEILNLGGGEISLSPSIINDLTTSLKEHKVVVNNFAFATNATVLTDEFLQELIKLKEYLDSVKNIFSLYNREKNIPNIHISISIDDFHLEEMIKKGYTLENFFDNIRKYREVFGDESIYFKALCDFDLIDEGRAKSIQSSTISKTPFKPLSNEFGFVNLKNKIIALLGILSVSTSGEVLPDCNFSFENEKVFSIGNIKDCKLSTILSHLNIKDLQDIKYANKFNSEFIKKHSVSKLKYKKYMKAKGSIKEQLVLLNSAPQK